MINLNNLFNELGVLITFGLSGLYYFDLQDAQILQWTILAVVYSIISINFCVAIVLSSLECRQKYRRWRQSRQLSQVII
jgi:hypothetical protein